MYNHKTTIMLSEEQHSFLKKKAYEEGSSLAYIIRELVNTIMLDKPKEDNTSLHLEEDIKKAVGAVAKASFNVEEAKDIFLNPVPKQKFNLKNKIK